MIIAVKSIEELPIAAAKIINLAASRKVFLFYGEMGAGKTTLIKALCRQLGVDENVSSPTFSIVNEYQIPTGKIYHFDFYRLKTQTEALDMGCEEYFYSGDYCFVEWPEMIPDLIPDDYIAIHINLALNNTREIHIQ